MKKVIFLLSMLVIMTACGINKTNNNDANEIENTEENVEQTTETAIDSSEEVKEAVVDTTDTTKVSEKEYDNSNL